MKDLTRVLIRAILLNIAIYSGAIAANSPDNGILMSILCGITCATFVLIKDDKKN